MKKRNQYPLFLCFLCSQRRPQCKTHCTIHFKKTQQNVIQFNKYRWYLQYVHHNTILTFSSLLYTLRLGTIHIVNMTIWNFFFLDSDMQWIQVGVPWYTIVYDDGKKDMQEPLHRWIMVRHLQEYFWMLFFFLSFFFFLKNHLEG